MLHILYKQAIYDRHQMYESTTENETMKVENEEIDYKMVEKVLMLVYKR